MKNNMQGFLRKPLLFLSLAALLFSCEEKKTGEQKKVEEEKKTISAPVFFNEDSAYKYVADQVNMGPRVPNTAPHIRCSEYLINSLKSFNTSVKVQSFQAKAFNGTSLSLNNIIASINPQASKRIILAAHWDTRPFADQDSVNKNKPIDGANDGASGVAVLLEIARNLNASKTKPTVGIDLVFFDGEDYGAPESFEGNSTDSYCLGAQYWAKNNPGQSYYGILLDMVGGKNARFTLEGNSMQYAPSIAQKVWETGNRIGYGANFIFDRTNPIIDDHYYVNDIAKIPMIDIIEYNNSDGNYFSPTWHKHSDNLSNIDKKTLKAVGQTLLEVIYNE